MKLRNILILLIIVVLGTSVVPVMAQDEIDDSSGVIAIALSDGSAFAYAEDGETLLLNILSPIDFAPAYRIADGEFRTINYLLADLEGDWNFAEELTAEAVLQLSDARLELIIGAPVYDFETGTFSYVVLDIEGAELDKDGLFVLPEFEEGSLFIRLSTVFLDGLLAGRDARAANTRAICLACGW